MTRESGMERIDELLGDEATQGLDANERRELEALLRAHPHVDADATARVAAQVTAATALGSESLPASLRAKVAADAERFFADSRRPQRPSARVIPLRRRSRWIPAAFVGWIAAAAAWVLVLFPDATEEARIVETSAASARAQLLAQAEDVVRLDWTATEDPAADGATGDVVWSNRWQQGYMRFRGLAANDPEVSQYQLWIFDAARDERYPVDGGVFDVSGDGEVVVPIRARLPVAEATLFAVTIERPGGVVVSDRKRLPLLAPVAS